MKPFGWIGIAFSAILAANLPVTIAAHASGFALREQSAAAQGNAFAGATAGAEDITYLFFNPAVLGRLQENERAGVLSFLAPRSKFRGGSASTVALSPTFPGRPIPGVQDRDDIAEDSLVPALYAMWGAGTPLRFGFGINAPFGLESSYDRKWIGRYHAVHSRLTAINLNPVLAARVTERLFFGAGLQFQHADAELSNALDFGTVGSVLPLSLGGSPVPGAAPGDPSQDGFFELKGDDWGYGWNAGLLFEPRPDTRFGFSYRSKVEHTFDAKAEFTVPSLFARAFAPTGLFRNSDAKADLTTPETWSAGLYQKITLRWAVMAEIARTRWSRVDELRIVFDNPAQPDNITAQNWKDTWFHAVGATFSPAAGWDVRAGLAHDESPVPDETRIPRIPDADRTWLSLGVCWRAKPQLTLNASYAHIWVEDADMDLKASDPGNTFRGDLAGSFANAIDIVALQIQWRF